MFQPPYELAILVRDAQGKSVDEYRTEWAQAGSATLFAEEEAWQAHRSGLGWPAAPSRTDDVLIAKRRTTTALAPRSRYELRVVRTDDRAEAGGAALFSATFTTSAFASFTAMASTYRGHAVRVAAKPDYHSALTMLPTLRASVGAFARAEAELLRAEADYRFEALAGGRATLESSKVNYRAARAAHDEHFRGLAERLADLYYPPVERMEIFVVTEGSTGPPVCLWVRSPETLDLRLAVPPDSNIEAGRRIAFVGRTVVALRRHGSNADLTMTMLHNADGTQMLLLPTSNTAWGVGKHTLSLTYHRDYGDDTSELIHRYDRPQEFRNGNADSETVHLAFTL
jgi:hypothetical protein